MKNKFRRLTLITTSVLLSILLVSNPSASEDKEATAGCWSVFKTVLKKMVPCMQVTADVAVDIADEFVDGKDQGTIDKVREGKDKVNDAIDDAIDSGVLGIETDAEDSTDEINIIDNTATNTVDNVVLVASIEQEEEILVDELTPLENKKTHKKKKWFERFRIFSWVKHS